MFQKNGLKRSAKISKRAMSGYCSTVWSDATEAQKKTFEIAQNKALRAKKNPRPHRRQHEELRHTGSFQTVEIAGHVLVI